MNKKEKEEKDAELRQAIISAAMSWKRYKDDPVFINITTHAIKETVTNYEKFLNSLIAERRASTNIFGEPLEDQQKETHTMKQEHIDAIIVALKGSRPCSHELKEYSMWSRIVEYMADAVEHFDDEFHRSRFLAACGAGM